jgi:dTDP-4-dehydrorhamnose reductase
MVAHMEGYSPRYSSTVRTARSRTSGEKRFDFLLMAPSSQSVDLSQNTGRFKSLVSNYAFFLATHGSKMSHYKNHLELYLIILITMQKTKRILVLGATGMLGNAVFRLFAESPGYNVFGSVRSSFSLTLLARGLRQNVVTGVDVENMDSLTQLFIDLQPDVVINCVGLVKQLSEADDPLAAIPINSVLPHRLARLCRVAGARLIHISTDCIFSGEKGSYTETDPADAKDLYGRSKFLGEVDYPHCITLRTSIIGHELSGGRSLIGWFLDQEGSVKGYRRAIFSGLPTVEVARVLRDHVIPHPELHGVYHLGAEPINKFNLLKLVAQTYQKNIDIIADDQFVIDRSLDSTRFRQITGFVPKSWPELVVSMRDFN